MLQSNCGSCHGATLQAGAPMSLVTYADLTKPAISDPTKRVYQVVAERARDTARPMPPDPTKRLSDTDIAALETWASGGGLAGAACDSGGETVGSGNAGAAGGAAPGAGGSAAPPAEESTAGDEDIETCYELRAHGQQVANDNSPYAVQPGEVYTGFIFKAPWTTPVQGIRFRHLADNAAVLHHWLLYAENAQVPADSIEACDVLGPAGFLCGASDTRALITGWAPGRGDFRMPKEAGLELPGPGQLLAVEFHYYNQSAPAMDRSGVEVCVTSKFRPNTASVSWLGTHTFSIPPKSEGTATGSCTPGRKGMNGTDPVNVLFSWPHMHKLGTHLKSIVNRADGKQETLYDGAFNFEFQVLHDTPLKLNPGDTVTTTCTFMNTTDNPVAFGQSTDQEMCYNFTYAWPAHALDNPSGGIGIPTSA
ncbi:MAG: hypothetical protein ABW321_05250, partial [Polyangiales bacterium]